jgi:hypothetical protein
MKMAQDKEDDPLVKPPPRPPEGSEGSSGKVISDYFVAEKRVVIPAKARAYVVSMLPREVLGAEMDKGGSLNDCERSGGLLPRLFSKSKKKAKNEELGKLLEEETGEGRRPDPDLIANEKGMVAHPIDYSGLKREKAKRVIFSDEVCSMGEGFTV